MKSLYIAFQPLEPGSGISNKITAEFLSLKNNGLDIAFCCQKYVNGELCYYLDDVLLYRMGKGIRAHFALYYKYGGLLNYIKKMGIKFVYIRYIQIANPFFNNFLRSLAQMGVKIYAEIPTYPYDSEYNKGILKKLQKAIEKHWRKRLYKSVDKIITFSNDRYIFNIPTVAISNGLDMDSISLRTPAIHKGLNLLCVAMLSNWHGYDRLIEGLGIYYQSGGQEDINIYIIGRGGDAIIECYQNKAIMYNILDRIHFEGVKSSVELDYYFNIADMAIGCLACHRKNVYSVKSLKNVEYAARGIIFAYSEDNDDFDNKSYVLKLTPNEAPVDIKSMLSFILLNCEAPLQIRGSIESSLSWDSQMKKVVLTIND